MKPLRLRDNNKTASRERQDAPPRQQQPGDAPFGSERRGRHRVADDQQSGAGSQTALSKLMMLERKRAALLPAKD
jgi:hypothetical protein